MTQHGYMMFTFRIHNQGGKTEPLRLGELPQMKPAAPKDGLILLYGAIHGLRDKRVTMKQRHLTVLSVQGQGRCVRFQVEVGNSGARSLIRDPTDPSKEPFQRQPHHIDNTQHWGLIVAPTQATTGLLILQSRGRTTGQAQLAVVLKRMVRRTTGLIVDFDALVHQGALDAFMEQAAIDKVTLRRSGIPSDIADKLEVGRNERDLGSLELVISKGKIATFKQAIASKFQADDQAREQLLQLHGIGFTEVTMGMRVGDRRTTLSITGDRTPSFTYNLSEEPSGASFYQEVCDMVVAVAPSLGLPLGVTWKDGVWSSEAASTVINPLPEEVTRDVGEHE